MECVVSEQGCLLRANVQRQAVCAVCEQGCVVGANIQKQWNARCVHREAKCRQRSNTSEVRFVSTGMHGAQQTSKSLQASAAGVMSVCQAPCSHKVRSAQRTGQEGALGPAMGASTRSDTRRAMNSRCMHEVQ
eukprot:1152359-Pelagomonas_calceolata.AAC.3